jgi:hypothetical protein
MRTLLKELLAIPSRIVYMIRYWEYVDYRVQIVFYCIVIMLMVGALAVGQGKIF